MDKSKPTYFPRGYGPRQIVGRERNNPQYRIKSPSSPRPLPSHEGLYSQENKFSHLVVHNKRSNYDVYIGNPSKWGTPFKIGPDGNRKECVQKYREWLTTTPEGQQLLEEAKKELPGKVLACWCAPLPCHGHVLAELVNSNSNSHSLSSSVYVPHSFSPMHVHHFQIEKVDDASHSCAMDTSNGEEDEMMRMEDETSKLRSKRYSTWRLNYYAMNGKVGYRQPFFVPVVLQHSAPLPVISVTFADGGQ